MFQIKLFNVIAVCLNVLKMKICHTSKSTGPDTISMCQVSDCSMLQAPPERGHRDQPQGAGDRRALQPQLQAGHHLLRELRKSTST